jgi:hypothetical protein
LTSSVKGVSTVPQAFFADAAPVLTLRRNKIPAVLAWTHLCDESEGAECLHGLEELLRFVRAPALSMP